MKIEPEYEHKISNFWDTSKRVARRYFWIESENFKYDGRHLFLKYNRSEVIYNYWE